MKIGQQLRLAALYARAMRSQRWSAERIRRHQEDSLLRIMRHAAAEVPYYQRLRLDPASLTQAADLERFPPTCKRDIQSDPEAFLARSYPVASLFASRTSGSSGEPTTTYFDTETWLLCKYALKLRRIALTAGLPLLRRVLIVSERPPEALSGVASAGPSQLFGLLPRRYVSIHSPVEMHLEELERYRPAIIYAFPSYFLDLIASAKLTGRALPQVPHLCTSSEVLTREHRARIESAFQGRIWDVYGSTEFKEVAWQCEHGRYHLNFESVQVESASLARGEIVLSTLCNRAMPLLRFQTGDQGTAQASPCPCGRQSQCFEAFVGRSGDTITLPSGRHLMPYLLTTAIEEEPSILQYRIVQTAIDAFRIDAVVRTPGQSAAWAERARADFERLAGEPLRVSVREQASLARPANGKRSVFVRAFESA